MRKHQSKYLKKTQRRPLRISLRPLCAFVVWLVLFSLMSSGVTYAKYQSNATATATANVARFGMAVTSTDIAETTTLTINGTDTADICTITFTDGGTEVAVNHVIKITGVPTGVSVTVSYGNNILTPEADGMTYIRSFAENSDKTGVYTVALTITDNNMTTDTYKGVSIRAYAEQAS